MLKSIYVKNFVLIDELTLDFLDGYSCFTGETGAGKSLLIDAISILCAGRASASYLQKGKDKAIIEAVFTISKDHPVCHFLNEAGWDLEDEDLIISREFNLQGKNTCRINHRNVNVSFLREVTSFLIDIHSQHDTQYLLNNRYHLTLLDEYLNCDALLNDVAYAYEAYHKEDKVLKHFMEEEASDEELDYLKYQLNEMNQVDIKENELEELEQKQKEMSSFDRISNTIKEAIAMLEQSGFDSIYDASKCIESIENEQLKKIKEQLLESYYVIDEQFDELKTYHNSLEFDEREFDEIQSRLYLINKTLRKHGGTYKSYIIRKKEIEERIAFIENRASFIEKQQRMIDSLYQVYLTKAKELSLLRKEKAKLLEKEVMEELQDLQLPNVQFSINFNDTLSEKGIDKVEFLVSMNVGESLKPLSKVASGGELSRLMLGLKTVFTRLQKITTIIFDEIDNGVSGSVAFAIGKKMNHIASNTQVFSVTHLAPVAAWAKRHYLVEKNTDSNDVTTTSIVLLDDEKRIAELAMISNGSLNDYSLAAARELRNQCK